MLVIFGQRLDRKSLHRVTDDRRPFREVLDLAAELPGSPSVALAACAGCEPLEHHHAVLQGADRRPERPIEVVLLRSAEAVQREGVPDAASEAGRPEIL